MVEIARAARSRLPLALVLVLAFALAVRVWKIDQKNLWLDEATSWVFATSPLPALVASTAADIHPPLYYVVLKGWIRVAGESLAGLRSLSALMSVLAIYLLWRFGDPYVSRGPLYAALLWLAVSPHMLYYAQEARMYSMAAAAVLAACVAYRRWVDSHFTRTTALAWVVIWGSAAIYLHYFTALALVAMWVHMLLITLGRRWSRDGDAPPARHPLLAWTIATAVIALIYLPWIPTAFTQITHGQSWRPPVTVREIPIFAGHMFYQVFFGNYGAHQVMTFAGIVALIVAALGLGRLLMLLISSDRHERDLFLALMCVVPVVLSLAALPKTGHMDLSRYLAFLLPFLVLGAARGLSALWRDPRLAVALLILAAATSLPSTKAYFADPVKDSDVRPIVAYLDAHISRDARAQRATLLIAPGYMTFCTDYASRGLGLAYGRVEDSAGLSSALNAAAQATPPPDGVWVIVDYRWSDFDTLRQNGRLLEVHVPGNHVERMRLFRVR
jgi:uncharacterized membrane protein